jgi:hypothetical protein
MENYAYILADQHSVFEKTATTLFSFKKIPSRAVNRRRLACAHITLLFVNLKNTCTRKQIFRVVRYNRLLLTPHDVCEHIAAVMTKCNCAA